MIHGGNKSFLLQVSKDRKGLNLLKARIKEKSIKIPEDAEEVDLGCGKKADCRAKNKGKKEVRREGKQSYQNEMALPQTETSGCSRDNTRAAPYVKKV